MDLNSNKNFDSMQTDLPYESASTYLGAAGAGAAPGANVQPEEKIQPQKPPKNDDKTVVEKPDAEVESNGMSKALNAGIAGAVIGFLAAVVLKQKRATFAVAGALAGAGLTVLANRKKKGNSSVMGGDPMAFAADGGYADGEIFLDVEGRKCQYMKHPGTGKRTLVCWGGKSSSGSVMAGPGGKRRRGARTRRRALRTLR
jgi:hypothetical protein